MLLDRIVCLDVLRAESVSKNQRQSKKRLRQDSTLHLLSISSPCRLTDSGRCFFRSSTECWTSCFATETGTQHVYCAEEWRVHSAFLGRSCSRARCCERQERMVPDSAENGLEVPQVRFLWLWTSL